MSHKRATNSTGICANWINCLLNSFYFISQSTISQSTVSQSTISQSTISQSTVSFRFVSQSTVSLAEIVQLSIKFSLCDQFLFNNAPIIATPPGGPQARKGTW